MATVLLFHHALGLTAGVEAFANDLREAGHEVEVPDLYQGVTFDSIEPGVAHAEQVGFDVIVERGVASAAGLGDELVVAGFSLGVLPAQKLAQTDPSVVGALLYHAALPLETFGERWPAGVRLQLHLTADDPWAEEDMDVAKQLAQAAGGGLHIYPGTAHLVADSSFSDFDPVIADQILRRTLEFLGAV